VTSKVFKGISSITVSTVSSVLTEIYIKDTIFKVEFYVIFDDYPVPKSGIL